MEKCSECGRDPMEHRIVQGDGSCRFIHHCECGHLWIRDQQGIATHYSSVKDYYPPPPLVFIRRNIKRLTLLEWAGTQEFVSWENAYGEFERLANETQQRVWREADRYVQAGNPDSDHVWQSVVHVASESDGDYTTALSLGFTVPTQEWTVAVSVMYVPLDGGDVIRYDQGNMTDWVDEHLWCPKCNENRIWNLVINETPMGDWILCESCNHGYEC